MTRPADNGRELAPEIWQKLADDEAAAERDFAALTRAADGSWDWFVPDLDPEES